MCISIKFPGGADAASWGPHLENLWPRALQEAPGTPQYPKDTPRDCKPALPARGRLFQTDT